MILLIFVDINYYYRSNFEIFNKISMFHDDKTNAEQSERFI